MYDNIQTQPRPLWNFTRLLAWHFSPTPGEAALGATDPTDPTGPVGPGADSFETFWVPKRCDLSRPFGDLSDRSWLGILCTQGFDFLLLKNIQRAWDKREAGELEAVICSGKSPYFWIELKPHCVVLRKSRLRYQPLATLRAFAAISPADPPLQLPRFDMMRSSNRLLVSLGCKADCKGFVGVSMVSKSFWRSLFQKVL